MSSNNKNYMTPIGEKKLKEEYHHLFHVERPKVVETVSWAAGNGDRSENADYIYGKRRLREIDARLRFLTGRLEKAVVVEPASLLGTPSADKISFGATVTVEDEDGNNQTRQIVGEDEWDVSQGKISWKSPVATALLGRKVGDEVTVKKPASEETLIIKKVEYK